jgi:hypothetical protein
MQTGQALGHLLHRHRQPRRPGRVLAPDAPVAGPCWPSACACGWTTPRPWPGWPLTAHQEPGTRSAALGQCQPKPAPCKRSPRRVDRGLWLHTPEAFVAHGVSHPTRNNLGLDQPRIPERRRLGAPHARLPSPVMSGPAKGWTKTLLSTPASRQTRAACYAKPICWQGNNALTAWHGVSNMPPTCPRTAC